ncbi:hypothetical protein EDD28_0084 [Salana multivorans]|uniref:Uncharacterized protein n=1 Tax=Salana multivorans TaxID=120377 RepID=A0A3N2D791_9MICO|nr:hypothetical protein [Salana multivorans]ROR95528.1 hypothetical protein EDD28_0084 [Salana multivorans]
MGRQRQKREKVQDVAEVERLLREGATYQGMVDLYRAKYNIETSIQMWAKWRSKLGLPTRVGRHLSLIPWKLDPRHRHLTPVNMLRGLDRVRSGDESVPEALAQQVREWESRLREADRVVRYEPATEQGFFYVPRRPEDDDIVRWPKVVTARREGVSP